MGSNDLGDFSNFMRRMLMMASEGSSSDEDTYEDQREVLRSSLEQFILGHVLGLANGKGVFQIYSRGVCTCGRKHKYFGVGIDRICKPDPDDDLFTLYWLTVTSYFDGNNLGEILRVPIAKEFITPGKRRNLEGVMWITGMGTLASMVMTVTVFHKLDGNSLPPENLTFSLDDVEDDRIPED